MERFILVNIFRKKGNTFGGITFFPEKVTPLGVLPLLLEFPEISVPFFHTYNCQTSHGNTSENAKDMKDGSRIPKRLSLQCVSLLVGSVGGRFRTQVQSCIVGKVQKL